MTPFLSAKVVIRFALKGTQNAVKRVGGPKIIIIPRILPVPSKVGGTSQFLVPLFVELSDICALAGGAAGIPKAVNDAKATKQRLKGTGSHEELLVKGYISSRIKQVMIFNWNFTLALD